jgi:hypothetical protein
VNHDLAIAPSADNLSGGMNPAASHGKICTIWPRNLIREKIQMPEGLTLNKITSQRGISLAEAARRVADLGWTPSYVQKASTFPTDYKITRSPRDPMKQVLRSYFPMQ